MQDRYAGDVGDYSKFVVARHLHRAIGGPVGLIWYRFPNESHNNDGRHVSYINHPAFQPCDPDLLQKLAPIAHSQDRSIDRLEKCGAMPPGTVFVNETIPTRAGRDGWFQDAKSTVHNCRIVIVDPDNGIAGSNHSVSSVKGGKHITHQEIRELSDAHDCLVIYHHFDRSAPHPVQIERQMSLLKTLAPKTSVLALRYRRFSPRAYFVVANGSCGVAVNKALRELTSTPWDAHFQLFQ